MGNLAADLHHILAVLSSCMLLNSHEQPPFLQRTSSYPESSESK